MRIQSPEDATLVCLVGENGTGKSNILELISAVAHHMGISPGLEIQRGNPFGERHSFSVSIKFKETIDSLLSNENIDEFTSRNITWSGIISVESHSDQNNRQNTKIIAHGEGDEGSRINLAHRLINRLRQRQNTHYLSLDADRAYPPLEIHPQHYGQALLENWEGPDKKKNRAFAPTRVMYEEWIKYFLAKEVQDATKLQQLMRRAKEAGSPTPEFVDGFDSYKKSVKEVLPHLNFSGVDTTHKTLLFDSAGLELKFTSLSGGEKEISFIIGQIERFQLKQGLLLIDEPELHLNPDLLRNWVAYLRDTVEDGQIWISTHSLEAVETAGPSCTFVLERTQDTRMVENIRPLINSPVLAVLSSAVGSPAFSLRNLKFVFVEGDRQGREKERFYSLFGDSRFVRFIEGGGCEEVSRKLLAVRELASEASEHLFVGGVIDADFRTQQKINELQARTPVYVLDCHEIENLYLHSEALQVICNRAGITRNVQEIIRNASDRFAGSWILQRTLINTTAPIRPERALNQAANQQWSAIVSDLSRFIGAVCSSSGLTGTDLTTFDQDLSASIDEYRRTREAEYLWKRCMGKQTLGVIYQDFGLSSVESLQNNITRIWANGEARIPDDLAALREYITSIE